MGGVLVMDVGCRASICARTTTWQCPAYRKVSHSRLSSPHPPRDKVADMQAHSLTFRLKPDNIGLKLCRRFLCPFRHRRRRKEHGWAIAKTSRESARLVAACGVHGLEPVQMQMPLCVVGWSTTSLHRREDSPAARAECRRKKTRPSLVITCIFAVASAPASRTSSRLWKSTPSRNQQRRQKTAEFFYANLRRCSRKWVGEATPCRRNNSELTASSRPRSSSPSIRATPESSTPTSIKQ